MTLDELKKDTRYWQRLLRLAGYYTGKIDGIRGPLQRAAETAWDTAVEQALRQHGEYDPRTEQNLSTLIPPAQAAARAWMHLALPLAEKLGVQPKIICGTRSYAEQDTLYAQGRTKPGPRVTNARAGYSWHNFGLAWDFGVFSAADGHYLTTGTQYNKLGSLARTIPFLTWGGDWTSLQDLPHIQLNKFPTTAAARAAFNK